ncbi:hypothetical protein [Pedobacter cryotolerans]|uniref:Uncharacterized protein n=1 Tax=Pedobacter cryotolerans TaxID=2571270 RepID=A0A4U1CFP8_9SPHI|nr:hypothetical protein [Pedobacter cryotolerans]TKC03181.1 hypothetical protein FA045_01015 [Pedobacter cryotolerans]
MKNKLLNSFLLFLAINAISINLSKAQYEFIPDQTTGKPLTTARYENVTGTPYLVDAWLNGEVKLANGSIVKPKAIKYDAVTDKLLFQQDGKIFEFFPRVAVFKLFAPNQTRTFLINDKNDQYFELLTDGDIKLLKKTKKVVLERKGYNSATVEKVIDENIKYFILVNDKQSEVKLNKKALAKLLPNYKSQIDEYTISQGTEENDYINLIKSLE